MWKFQNTKQEKRKLKWRRGAEVAACSRSPVISFFVTLAAARIPGVKDLKSKLGADDTQAAVEYTISGRHPRAETDRYSFVKTGQRNP